MKKSSLCSMIWQDRHITLHGSGGGGVVGRGAFSEDKGLGSDGGDGGDSGTPPGCCSGEDCGDVAAQSNCIKTLLSDLARYRLGEIAWLDFTVLTSLMAVAEVAGMAAQVQRAVCCCC